VIGKVGVAVVVTPSLSVTLNVNVSVGPGPAVGESKGAVETKFSLHRIRRQIR
jgi:hypothetical protein